MKSQRHVVHLVYRFAVGGLENVIVQLINGLPPDEFRHTVVALTEVDPAFSARIERKDVEVISLQKKPGQPFAMYPRMYGLLRRLKPDVLHTCNIAALEFMPVAWLAKVPRRIHAEHGWDVNDPDGSNRGYQRLRRLYRPFVHHFIAVSAQLRDYLRDAIRVPKKQLHLLPNGVDTDTFRPAQETDVLPNGYPFLPEMHWVVGTIGRLEPIKNQILLVEAFIKLVESHPQSRSRLRLAIVGSGPLANTLFERMRVAGLEDALWMPGGRSDIPDVLRSLDCFVLPSLAEGTSCTLLEAMASNVPVVATAVGGNSSLLKEGALGLLVPTSDVEALSQALSEQMNSEQKKTSVAIAREHVMQAYSMTAMLHCYSQLFAEA